MVKTCGPTVASNHGAYRRESNLSLCPVSIVSITVSEFRGVCLVTARTQIFSLWISCRRKRQKGMMKTLSAEESKTLYALLKSEQRPLDEIASDFNSKFPPARQFVACSSLVLLLQAMCSQFLSLSLARSLYIYL
jgi:hypothetical protein